MAPFNKHAVSTIESAQVVSHDEKTILVEAGGFTPVRWFFERGQQAARNETSGDDEERPRKKRKTGRKVIAATPATPSARPAVNTIPLGKVTIDLSLLDTLAFKPQGKDFFENDNDDDFADAVEVSVIAYGIGEERGGVHMRMALPEHQGAVLKLELDDSCKHVLADLRSIALPGPQKATLLGTAKSDYPATITRCVLKRSTGKHSIVRLEASVAWRDGVSAFPVGVPAGKPRIYADYDVKANMFPDAAREEMDHTRKWAPQDFYDSVHVPARQDRCELKRVLDVDLYPFQQRAVKWMLLREGVEVEDKQIVPAKKAEIARGRLSFFEEVEDSNGEPCFVNHLQGIVARHRPESDDYGTSGGLLAEEMGLGKTVELMALIALHKCPTTLPGKVYDRASGLEVLLSRATLIVSPNSILPQWRSELGRHAPALKVMVYDGIPSSQKKAKKSAEQNMLDDLTNNYDVVLTTYNVLSHEIHFAEDPPDRSRRFERAYERKRSPLVQVQFWRVVMDEAQMIEGGTTAAARVASRLPRVNSWAVTGTPLPRGIAHDLHGLCVFLRLKPFDDNLRLWTHMVTNHRQIFQRIMGQIALRHTKTQIRDELRLPAQKRVVITMPFTAVEQQQYNEMFDNMCEELKLNIDGSQTRDDWDPDQPVLVEKMRQWLIRLRQTCLHPEIGTENRKALGKGNGPLRTVLEVLGVMIDQNETNMRTQERAAVASHILRGHVVGNAGDDESRSDKALAMYKEALETSSDLVKDARQRLKTAQVETGAGSASSDSEGEDSRNEAAPLIGALRSNLRTALQLQHICAFFSGNTCFQSKSNEKTVRPESAEYAALEKQESAFYDQAKAVRRELLHDAARRSEALMKHIRDSTEARSFTKMPKIRELPGLGGIESRRIVDKSDDLFEIVRQICKVVEQWRAKMADFLTKPLVDEDDGGNELTGEEYEESTKQQDELYVYFDALKAMQADLNTFITGEREPLIDHEVKYMVKIAQKFLDPEVLDEFKQPCHAPEKLLELCAVRNKFRKKVDEVGSVRGLIHEARALESSMQWQDGNSRAGAEASFVKQHLTALQTVFTSYTKALAGLEKEVDFFRRTQNQRLEFYRQLQELSDAVAPYKEELDECLDVTAAETAREKEEQQNKLLATLRTKNRFLLHLRSESGSDESICVICQYSFQNGVLTVCGHTFCKICINTWWQAHHTCPVCKRVLKTVDFHNITYRPSEMRAREEVGASNSSPSKDVGSTAAATTQSSTIYTGVDQELMAEIKMIDLSKSYGTKIDTLARHLLWIRKNDAGAKSIVFSQYREFLNVLGAAFLQSKIGYTRLGRPGAVEKFRQNPSIDCLLLDAKTNSSGLTLVNATHVFICEPLIQTAVELQAIARVHRIGQTRQTTIWMYLVNGTVEESIYDISVARRMAHVQARQQASKSGKSRSTTPAPLGDMALEAADTEELQSAPMSKLLSTGKAGGEVVVKDDLWQCLFGKPASEGASSAQDDDDETTREVDRQLRATAVQRRVDGRD